MNTRYYMVIIKGEIKTSEIMSCGYNRNTQKWDVKFNNGKTYSYAYLNVEKLTDPEVLNPNMYRISREGREFFDVNAIYVFRSGSESYWHICFGDGSERDYRLNDLHIIESCLTQSQSSNVFEYIKQIAGLSNIRNEETGEKLLSKRFDKISFVGSDVALAKYLNPSSLQGKRTGRAAYKNAGFIDKLHKMGIKVSLWTVDTEDSVRSLLRTSADAYITNRPDRVREWMEKEQAATTPTETATAESAPTAEADAGTAAAE